MTDHERPTKRWYHRIWPWSIVWQCSDMLAAVRTERNIASGLLRDSLSAIDNHVVRTDITASNYCKMHAQLLYAQKAVSDMTSRLASLENRMDKSVARPPRKKKRVAKKRAKNR